MLELGFPSTRWRGPDPRSSRCTRVTQAITPRRPAASSLTARTSRRPIPVRCAAHGAADVGARALRRLPGRRGGFGSGSAAEALTTPREGGEHGGLAAAEAGRDRRVEQGGEPPGEGAAHVRDALDRQGCVVPARVGEFHVAPDRVVLIENPIAATARAAQPAPLPHLLQELRRGLAVEVLPAK